MKSIFKFSALALLATALMASCAKDIKETDMPVEGKKITKTFTLTFAQPDTKVAVTDAGKTTWEVGDEIMIHGGKDGAARQLVTLTADDIKADGKNAVITVDLEPYDRTDAGVVSKFYAQYPARLVPEGNMYYECRFTGADDFLMAACDVGDTFVFYNLCGIISFQVSGPFDNFELVGNNGEGIGFKGLYQARVRLDEGKDEPKVTNPKFGNGGDNPGAAKSFAAELKEGTNYIYIPAGTNFTAGFTFKFYDGTDLVKIAKTETPVDVAPGKILVLGDISAKLEDYEEPTTSDHKSEITGAQDLSAAQANCFVITAPGAYKFPALKGSSDEEAGNVWGAEIVWESCNNAEEVAANSVIAAVDFEDNWVYFKTPDALKAGNAVIAAKDANDKIIWSWHIWIPSTAIETNTYGLFDKELMDRNLGALVAAKAGEPASVESFGLTYQWGRKDPFVGPAATSGSDNAAVAGTAPSAAAGQISLGESIANPTILGHVNNGDWLTAPDNTLWQNDEKTIYDPCPAGYKVPARDKTQPLMMTITEQAGWNVDGDNAIITVGDPAAVFPICGYRDDYEVAGYAKIGSRVAYWTSYASGEAKGYHLNWRFDKGTYTLDETAKARGAYVRCVKTEEGATPEPPQPQEPIVANITIDGDMSDWADVPGVSNDTYGMFKVAADENNLYIYSVRTPEGRYSAIWGGEGYLYLALELDGDPATGETLWGNGPFEFVGVLYPYAGSADAPAINETPGDACLPEGCTLANATCKGVVNESGAAVEICIPRADLPTIPTTKITVWSWGNKDMAKVSTDVLLPEGAAAPASVVVFEDDFEWLEPYSTAVEAPDDVADNKVNSTKNIFTTDALKPIITDLQTKGYGYVWGGKGLTEWSTETPEGDARTLYLLKNYLKFGKTDWSSGIILPALSALTGTANVELTFDWCWCMTGKSKPDIMTLTAEVVGGEKFELSSAQPTEGDQTILEWQHASVTINGVTPETRIILRPTNVDPYTSSTRGQNRWYLDNIKIVTK